jgi:hypothetical protein
LGSGRRYKRQNIGAEKGEPRSEPEWRGPCTIIQIVEIPHIKGEEEEFHSSPIIEELLSPIQTGSCVESMTPCMSPQYEITVEGLSKELVVSGGNQNSNSRSSGGSKISQNQPASLRGGAT